LDVGAVRHHVWLKDIALLRKLKHRGLFKGVEIYLRGSGLQLGEDAKADSDSSCCLMGPQCLCGPRKLLSENRNRLKGSTKPADNEPKSKWDRQTI
jgi:hypothetical protein